MQKPVKFNYIITIHNKEELIGKVLYCVLMCSRDNSNIYPVLDGCTDNSEKIIDEIIENFSGIPIKKVYTNDVHELLSINAGLKAACQEGDGFNIILQDDVLLGDFLLEDKVKKLYEFVGPKLGYVSFRLGANFLPDAYSSNNPIPYTDYVENSFGHGLKEAENIYPGQLAFRTVPIKSPVCIPFKLIRDMGMYNENLSPYGHDDLEYSIRLIKAGYKNAVFPIQFYSDVKWGGTRTTPHPELNEIVARNMNKIRVWYRNDLKNICEKSQPREIINLPGNLSSRISNVNNNTNTKKNCLMTNSVVKELKPYYGKFKKNIYSQNGEDGIIEQLCNELNISKGWFCEFGAWDGKYLSNCYNLLDKGWHGIMIEGDNTKFNDLRKTREKYPDQIVAINKYVEIMGKNSLDNILNDSPIPKDFELLSIDIDGADYYIWESLKQFKPKIVIVEVNSNYPPFINVASEKGSSFGAMNALGIGKGYTLICHNGNTIFARNDLIKFLSLSKEEIEKPSLLFDEEQFPCKGKFYESSNCC